MAHAEAPIDVTVLRSLAPRQVDTLTLRLPAGSTLQDALMQCGWWPEPPNEVQNETPNETANDTLSVGVWGKLQSPGLVLRDQDRVEIYRGLRVDPKQARRERYADHKARTKAAEEVAAKRKRQR
jgi:putative ubiquitin-RnfH superfamily antitoxin RatB of RatAB toxin-antitoxin module